MPRTFGNYEIIRKLATGGMAEVYLAKQTSLGGFERLVCIKRILPHLSEQEDFIKMFQDEARIVANLNHPNVAQIYDIDCLDGSYYIAMEYVRGEDLRRVYNQEVARGHAMPLEPAAHIAMGAAAGLDYAHRQTSIDGRPLGIVHRDVSPQNILVTYDGHVKLVDFGVAKAEGKLNETRSGVLKGKYSYMSPEQASGDPIDGRTDIFALGITLYEVTTGVRLFKRENEIETLHAVIECSVTAPGELVPGYDETLQEIVMRALAHDPDDRYPTAGDMERDLERFLIGRGHTISASSMGAYMQDLFAEKIADELLFGRQPWDESVTPSRGPDAATRRYGSKRSASKRSRSAGRAPSRAPTPADAAPTAIGTRAGEETAVDPSAPSGPPPRRARRAVWGAPSDWETAAGQGERTTTHEPGARPSGQSRRSGPRTPLRPVQPKGTRWLPTVALSVLIIGAGVATGLLISSQQRSPNVAPRSGALAVDSEPRGARVEFLGSGSAPLNQNYSGRFTPFTVVEGIPIENALRARFLKEGFEVAEVGMPSLQEGVVPEPLFVALPAAEDGNEPGALILLSTPPGATVFIDGNKIGGVTPLTDVHVRGGENHKVEFYLDGYKPRWETAFVEPGSRRFVEMTLTPAGAPEPEAVAAPPVVASPEPPPRKAPKATKAPDGRAYLTVTSPLSLRVTVDSRYVGETPVRRLSVAPGVRRLKLKSEAEGFTLRRKVRVARGRTEAIEINPRKGNLSLNATPWAWVSIGKTAPSETPVRLEVYEGEYAVLFECPDGSRKRQSARVLSGQTTSVSVACR